MMEVNIREARTHLSRLLRQVAKGEEVTIVRTGKPIARLVAVEPTTKYTMKKRPLGMDRGKIWIADDFDAPDPEIESAFYDAPLTTNAGPKSEKRHERRSPHVNK